MRASLFALLISLTVSAHAEDSPFRLSGDVKMTPVPRWRAPVGRVLGVDPDGYRVELSSHPFYPLACVRPRTSPPDTSGVDDTDGRAPFISPAPGGITSGNLEFFGKTVDSVGDTSPVVQIIVYASERPTAHLRRVTCKDAPIAPNEPLPLETGAPIPISFDGDIVSALVAPHPPLNVNATALAWHDRVCIPLGNALWCIDLDDASPALSRLVTADEVAAEIDIDPLLLAMPRGVPYELSPEELSGLYDLDERSWFFRAVTALPDGRFVAVIASEPGTSNLLARVAFAVSIHPDGRLERILQGPSAMWEITDPDGEGGIQIDTNTRAPLLWVNHLAYDASLDAVLAGPIDAFDWSGKEPVRPAADGSPLGWFGSGFLVWPVGVEAGQGVGYLSVVDAIARSGYITIVGPGGGFGGARDWIPRVFTVGAVTSSAGMASMFVTLEYPHAEGSYYELTWKQAALDLDRDGLNRAREAVRGTSDFAWDSDLDGVEDGLESVRGSDPARYDSPNAAAGFDKPLATWSLSPLLAAWRIPGLAGVDPTFGVEGPLCAKDICYGPSGEVVAHAQGTRSVDGEIIVTVEGDRVLGHDLTTGERFVWTSIDALAATVGHAEADAPSYRFTPAQFVPVQRGSLFVTAWTVEHFWVLHVDGEGRIDVRFDQQALRCAAELGPCDPNIPDPNNPNQLAHHDLLKTTFVGYHLETDRLLLGQYGVWEGYLVGVHATEPLAILARSHTLARQNRHTHQGDLGTAWRDLLHPKLFPTYLVPTGHGDYFSDRWIYDDVFGDGPMAPYEAYIGMDLRRLNLSTGWGDTVVDRTGLELVKVEQRVLPGDVLTVAWLDDLESFFGGRTYGSMLYRVGPRGGLAPLWSTPMEGLLPIGMDVSPSGRVCFADYATGGFFELSPIESGSLPVDMTVSATSPVPIVDCFYEDDDTLLLLTAAPAIERYRRGDRESEVIETLAPQAALPRHFVRTATGYTVSYEPVERLTRPDGLRVRLFQPGTDQIPVPVFEHPDSDDHVLVAAGIDEITRPPFATLGLVPGGEPRDPWTGELLSEGKPWPLPAAATTPEPEPVAPDRLGPAPMTTPEGGTPLPSEPGCATGGATSFGLLSLILWLAHLARTSRAMTRASHRRATRAVLEV
jgi:hypothetical protein